MHLEMELLEQAATVIRAEHLYRMASFNLSLFLAADFCAFLSVGFKYMSELH